MDVNDFQEQHENKAGETMTLRELARLWWVIALVAVVATAAAYVFSAIQPAKYSAEATLLYTGDPALLQTAIQSVSTGVTDQQLEARVAEMLGRPLPSRDSFNVSSTPGAPPVGSVGVAAGQVSTNLALVTVESSTALLSARLANAYADAFVARGTEGVRSAAKKEAKRIRAQLADYTKPSIQGSSDYNFLASTYVALTQRLSDLEVVASGGTGGFRVFVRAVPPARPFAPRPARATVLGLVLGVFGGVGLALLLRQFDTRLTSGDEVSALLHLPVLARIPRVVSGQPDLEHLVSVRDPAGVEAEAYRKLRSGLEYVAMSKGAKALLLTSPCEDEGTSITLSNVAVALARSGAQVAVVDANLRFPVVHAHFGIPNDKGVSTVVAGQTSLVGSLQSVAVSSSAESPAAVGEPEGALHGLLRVLTSGPPVDSPGEILAGQRMGEVIAELRESADIVLVGSSALLDAADALALASKVDGLVLLVDMHACRRPALQESREVMSLLPCQKLGVVLTGFPRTGGRRRWNSASVVTRRWRGEKHVPSALPLSPETGAEQ
jgi:Mrp family chromosome partitioning ATPase